MDKHMTCLLFRHVGDWLLRGAGFGSLRASGQLAGGVYRKQRCVCDRRCPVFLLHIRHLQHSAMCDGTGRNFVGSCIRMSCSGFKYRLMQR